MDSSSLMAYDGHLCTCFRKASVSSPLRLTFNHLARRSPFLLGKKPASTSTRHKQSLHTETVTTTIASTSPILPSHLHLLALPSACPGCGAFTQLVSPEGAGFYTSSRKSVKAYLAGYGQDAGSGLKESGTYDRVLVHVHANLRSELGHDEAATSSNPTAANRKLDLY